MNENSPSISIIVPVYNGEAFIEKAFHFLKTQTVKLSYEVIFVDNNSKDNSFYLLKNLVTKYEFVKVFKELKQGAAAARNKGFKESKGDFIYFYDVDDQLFPDTLETLSDILIQNKNIDAVFGKMLKSSVSVQEINFEQLEETSTLIIEDKSYWGLKWFNDLSSVVGPPAFLYKREVFDKIGLYEEELLTGQDTALDIKLGMLCNIAHIDKYVYLYLKHNYSTTDAVKKKKSRDFMQWPRITKSHLPFYLEGKGTEEFKLILLKKIYSSIGKMLQETRSESARKKLKEELYEDIRPLKIPFLLRNFHNLLIKIPNENLLKIYLYYLMPYSLRKLK